MPDCLLVLYWPDFAGADAARPGVTPALLAETLHRRLALQYDEHCGYVWSPPDDASPSSASGAFPRWGFRMVSEPFDPQRVAALARQHPDLDHALLLMSAARAQPLVPLLEGMGRRVQVGLPGAAPQHGFTVPTRTVEDALHLSTARTVGLFVDWRAVARSSRAAAAGGIEAARSSLLHHASLVGSVITARIYGPGDGRASVEVAGTAPPAELRELRFRGPEGREAREGPQEWGGQEERDSAEELQADLWSLLDDPTAPGTWILVSDAAWLPQLLMRVHARGIRVLLWPPDLHALPADVLAEADGHTELPLQAPSPLPRFRPLLEVRPAAPSPALDLDGFQMPEPARELPHGYGSVTSARLCSWMRLVYYTESMLRRNGWSKVAFRKLAARLAELDEFGPTPANAMMWLNRAKAEGLLLVDQDIHRADPSLRVTVCRPNAEQPLVRLALDVPDRSLRLLQQMLQKIPWVSFKLLRNVLLREQWLGGPPYRLDEAGIDEWLNFLIADGAIRMTKEPNLVNPDYPVTALRLNDEHPFSRAMSVDAGEGTRLAAERAILAVDHFLKRQRKPWMAMSALRRSLESLGREELQAVLQGLQNLGALVTESYPNPQREHFTTGCRLQSDVPLVSSVLELRDCVIRVTQLHQRSRSWVSLPKLDEELSAGENFPPSPHLRLAWYLLLRDEGILEMDPDAGITPETWDHVRCRLNVSDAVVRAVVAVAGDGVEARALPVEH